MVSVDENNTLKFEEEEGDLTRKDQRDYKPPTEQ